MATPFSAPDEAILTSIVTLSELTLSSTSSARNAPIDDLYDIVWLADKIRRGSFQKVALQFPDELLCDASHILWSLQAHLRKRSQEGATVHLFILADTSYGNCCVDEVAAEHIDADLVVHFGHACLSLTSRLPVIYIFHKLPIDIDDAVKSLSKRLESLPASKKLAIRYDVGYEHAVDEVTKLLVKSTNRDIRLRKLDKNINFERYMDHNLASKDDERLTNGDQKGDSVGDQSEICVSSGDISEDSVILYIGPESLALTNLLLKLGTKANVISYDPSTRRIRDESGSTNKLLQRRYFAVQKARDAHTVALLVGTLGLRSYLPLISKLRKHLTEVQKKKVYTISVGKLNPAKLANFQEIDVFVLIACPENSLVEAKEAQRSKDYFRPIVTPFELMMAFKGRDWTGEYILNLETIFADMPKSEEKKDNRAANYRDEEEEEEEPHFSLVTGGLVSTRDNTQKDKAITLENNAELGVVAVRDSNGVLTRIMDSAGGQHIASRSWRGLEQRLGMDEAAPLEIGRSGIAKGYVAGTERIAEGQRE